MQIAIIVYFIMSTCQRLLNRLHLITSMTTWPNSRQVNKKAKLVTPLICTPRLRIGVYYSTAAVAWHGSLSWKYHSFNVQTRSRKWHLCL